jgi:hypothetical protein
MIFSFFEMPTSMFCLRLNRSCFFRNRTGMNIWMGASLGVKHPVISISRMGESLILFFGKEPTLIFGPGRKTIRIQVRVLNRLVFQMQILVDRVMFSVKKKRMKFYARRDISFLCLPPVRTKSSYLFLKGMVFQSPRIRGRRSRAM